MGEISYDDKVRKGPLATKLTRPQPTRLPCVGVWCFKHFTNFSQCQKTIPEL